MKFISALLLAMLPLVSLADNVVPVEKVKDSVNIRSEPDAGSDVVGRLKQGESLSLVNAVPGWYEVQLDASSLASGIYYYRLQAGTFVDLKKLLLVK